MRDVVAVEWLKLRRAPVVWAASVLAVVVMPLLAFAFLRLAGSDVDGILTAKLEGMVIGTGWAVALSIAVVTVVAAIGGMTGLESGGVDVVAGLVQLLVLALLTSLLALPLALAASLGRGYLPGMGTLIAVVVVAQVAMLFGAGGWFPFAAPGLWSASWQQPDLVVAAAQLALVPAVAVIGIVVTARWWDGFELH